jgi:hypothetical protein
VLIVRYILKTVRPSLPFPRALARSFRAFFGALMNRAGQAVPADLFLLSATSLEIDEAAVTGESIPNPKRVGVRAGRGRGGEEGARRRAQRLGPWRGFCFLAAMPARTAERGQRLTALISMP